jgi:hypothetical protein
MSSLVSSASTWTNDDNSARKRTPTMRKTIKSRPYMQSLGEPDQYITTDEDYQSNEPTSITDLQGVANNRNDRVNELLNKITSADTKKDNSKLGNFTPLGPPALNVKRDMDDNTDPKIYIPPMPAYSGPNKPSSDIMNKSTYGANASTSAVYSNYAKSYEPPQKLSAPYYANMGIGAAVPGDNKLLEKINYMIHMLEAQQNEKTSHITEEFILYTFLGVFIIFVVDSFARSGKYRR